MADVRKVLFHRVSCQTQSEVRLATRSGNDFRFHADNEFLGELRDLVALGLSFADICDPEMQSRTSDIEVNEHQDIKDVASCFPPARPENAETDVAEHTKASSALQPTTLVADVAAEVRLALRLRGPSARVLDIWERNSNVKDILRWFVLEEAIGQFKSLKFREVDLLLEAMNLPKKEFVSKFTKLRLPMDVDAVVQSILQVFKSDDMEGQEALKLRDLFCLLEMSGLSLRAFGLKFTDSFIDCNGPALTPFGPKIGSYRVSREIGSGFEGPCVYMAEHVTSREKVALKWPAKPDEVAALREIVRRAPAGSPGIPRLHSSGYYDGRYFLVTELLGSPLSKVIERLQKHSLQRRWDAIRIIGRLLLRRLEVLHNCGFVHCDISPENFLLGRARNEPTIVGGGGRNGSAIHKESRYFVAPYLVDFGWARKTPGGGKLRCDHGSVEWNSIRSASGGERCPADDLEALGWMLMYGLVGGFPWCQWLVAAYQRWDQEIVRERVIMRVREAKMNLLNQGGWGSLVGEDGKNFERTTSELQKFIRMCHDITPPNQPDYDELAHLLGSNKGNNRAEAEEHDLREYEDDVMPWL